LPEVNWFRVTLGFDDLQQAPLKQSQDIGQFVPPLKHLPSFSKQRPHTLPVTERWTLFDTCLRTFGRAPKSAETGGVFAEIHRIIPPNTGSDHAAIDIKDTLQFEPVETDLKFRSAWKYNNVRAGRNEPCCA